MGTASPTDALTDIHTGDPYPVYARLRQSEPVYRSRNGAYLLTRYPDCQRVLAERDFFLAPGGPGPGSSRSPCVEPGPAADGAASHPAPVLARVMSAQNPPRHTRMRAAVARRFLDHVRGQGPWLHGLCDRLLEPVARPLRGGAADLTALAEAFPREAVMHLLGLPRSDRDLVSALIAAIFPTSGPMPAREGGGAAAMRQLTGYLAAQARSRRRAPGTDLTSELVRAHTAHPDLLPADELVSILTGLMVAGYPQIAAGIETGIVLMIRHPRQALFLDSPATARQFVDEVLRYDAPVQFTPAPRVPTDRVVIGGVPIPAGAPVWPVLGAANRDPGTFRAPDDFSPGRAGARHLSFGGGTHYCLGAELVYLEMSMMLRRLRQRLPGLALAQPPVQRLGRLRGFTSVPVTAPER